MLKPLESLGNVFRIPELRRKVLITLGLLIICRVGVYVPIPGLDTSAISEALKNSASDLPGDVGGKVIGLVNMFSGGALKRATVFALGIMPYISASIIFQLLTTVVKPLEELQKEGEAGRKKINQYTRYATVILCIVQGFFVANWLKGQGFVDSATFSYYLVTVFSVTAGTIFLMWIGEQITEFGIGNGISLIIMTNIVARMPAAIGDLARTKFQFALTGGEGKFGLLMAALLVVVYLAVVVGVVIIQQAQRRITVQQAKHTRGRRVYGGQKHYMPLRVNQAGVIPIIFAQSLLMFPAILIGAMAGWFEPESGFSTFLAGLRGQLLPGNFIYIVIYMALIVFFCFFWTAIVFNPIKMADDMKQYGHFIPGIRPGNRTADYLEKLMTRITLAGAAFLVAIAILPQLFSVFLGLPYRAAALYGGTGLLIVVGVALDLVQKIESHLVMRHYGGFLKGTRIRGSRR